MGSGARLCVFELDSEGSNAHRNDRQLFDLIAVYEEGVAKRKGRRSDASDLNNLWLPIVDNLRNFLLTTTTEMLFRHLREAP